MWKTSLHKEKMNFNEKSKKSNNMLFEPACILCIVKQAYNTTKLAVKKNKNLHIKIFRNIFSEIQNINQNNNAIINTSSLLLF
jgi:hypothetical protein